MKIECACGCGQLIEDRDNRGKPRRYIKGHIFKGKKLSKEHRTKISKTLQGRIVSEETRRKLSESLKGRQSPMLGKKQTAKARRKISEAKKGSKHPFYGIKFSETYLQNLSNAKKGENNPNYGKKMSDEQRKKISKSLKGENHIFFGKKFSEETRKKMSESRKGIKYSEETRLKISESKKGENNHNWKGGISFEPYCPKFNNSFKESIRKQFDYKCFICGISQDEQINRQRTNGKQTYKLSVHHVNYNKNCLCDEIKCEFVPLCMSCHTKTNNNRENWEKIINNKLRLIVAEAVIHV